MFFLLTGKPDTKARLFNRNILVSPEDLGDLKTKIADKLALHSIQEVTLSAVVKFDKESLVEFGSWTEFEHFDWKKPYATRELSLRWDFLLQLPGFEVGQRHTLTVRLASPPSPQEILRLMVAQDPDDDIDLSGRMALCMARVDFISHRLADELIDVVEEWNSALSEHHPRNEWFASLEKHHKRIPRFIHLTVPAFTSFACWMWLRKFTQSWSAAAIEGKMLHDGLQWIFLSLLLVSSANIVGRYLAGRCHNALHEYGNFNPFRLTRGDENRAQKLEKRNRKQVVEFVVNCALAVALNLVATFIAVALHWQ